jgi:arylsulfatase A-like enzyme
MKSQFIMNLHRLPLPRAAVAASLALLCAFTPSLFATRPNIIVILADDMGFSDLGCYGSEIPTPHLDSLAANGVRFTQFYNTGRCCPTRASLLTGLYPHQAGVGHMTDDDNLPGYRGFLNDHCVTIGDVLRSAGYLTAVTGKWHVGHKDPSMLPLQRGFDRFYGVPEGGGFFFKVKEGRSILLGNEPLHTVENNTPEGWYSTDAWTEWGLKFIDEALDERKPFFLYLAHNAPHFPLQAPREEIEKFRGKYKNGWGSVRDRRHARMIELGIIDPAWSKAPRPEAVQPWSRVSEEERERFDHIMAVYAACVHLMDRSIGDLVEGLRRRGILDDTLILFLSDNGGNAESGPQGKSEGDPATPDSNWFCGESWAFPQNTPFRLYKHYNHEGGIATPLIMHWPNGLRERGGITHQTGHLIDIMSTCVDAGQASYPAAHNGKPVTPMEGKSLLKLLQNEEPRTLYWEHEGNAAVREGDMKLVRRGRNSDWELYDMKADRTELNDLAASQPGTRDRLSALWEDWAMRALVKPEPAARGGKGKGKAKAKSN